MEFDLKGTITLSGDATAAASDIAVILNEASSSIFSRPDGSGAAVKDYEIAGCDVKVHIVSGRNVRAHEAIIRLRKLLGERLGKSHRLGARKLEINSYVLRFELEREPKRAVTVPFAELAIEGRTAIMRLTDPSEEFLQKNYVDRMIKLVREKVDKQYYEGKAEYWKCIWDSGPKEPAWTADPSEEMLKRGWLKQGPTKGKWFFRPQVAAVMRAMERIAIEEVVRPLGFQEVIEPHHVGFDIWLKTGHLEGMPGEIYYVSEPRTRDPAEWERFVDLIKITKQVPQEELAKNIQLPNAGSCYAQCPVIYWSLQGETIADESLPVKVFDRAANSNRYESGGRHGIERVDEFHRIEVVYIGTEEQLVALREKLLDAYKRVFNEILELEWRMAWVTPFYMQQSGQNFDGGDDGADLTKLVKGTIDFEAYMPYRGSREESEWLEFQNLTIVGDKYTSAFNIKGQKSELWSGCTGIGLERWTAAFLSQKGLDPEKWPEGFRKYLPKLPEGMKLL